MMNSTEDFLKNNHLCAYWMKESCGRSIHAYAIQHYFSLFKGRFMLFHDDPCQDLEVPSRGYLKHTSLSKGDVVVDAGAYTGHFTVLAAKMVGPSGKVIAFEPDPINRMMLERNLKLNKVHNVIVSGKALWDHPGHTQLSIAGEGSSIVEGTVTDGIDDLLVETVRAEDELNALGVHKVDFVKMDVEGSEVEAIAGFGDMLRHPSINFAVASYHVLNGERTARAVETILGSHGFNAFSEYPRHLTTYGLRSIH